MVEREFAVRLRSVARRIQEIVRGFVHPSDEELPPDALAQISAELDRYAQTIAPWATAVSRRMLADVERRDKTAWQRLSRQMGHSLWQEIEGAPIGNVLRQSLERQVGLITSLPREAADRVHNLALTGLATGRRAGEIRYPARPPGGLAKDILDTGHVTVSRANTIARTETSRAAGELTAARAEYVGSTHFIWRATMDADTRPLHRKLNGRVFPWAAPPIAGDKGEHALPGGIYNCRCWADPILPEKIV